MNYNDQESAVNIGIADIASYIPDNFLSNTDRMSQFDIDEDFLKIKIGTSQVSRKFPDQDTSDLCVKAFEALEAKRAINREDVDCMIVVTQNPDGEGLPHTSSIVHGKLNLRDDCAVFDISLGCSGYVYGLSIVRSFMMANGFKCGLLFTSDPYSKIVDSDDKNTSLLFGDAATVTLLSVSPVLSLKKFSFATRGSEGDALKLNEGVLSMNGRAVFNFCATVVPKQITALINDNQLTFSDIDIFLVHQGSRFIVDTLSRKLKIESDKIPLAIEGQGNTVSSSIPLLLEKYIHRKEFSRFVISGFGVGLSWSTGLLERI